MKKRVLLIAFGVIIIALFTIVSILSTRKPENPFPLSKETIEEAFEEQDLQWELGDTQSWQEGHINYAVHNQNGKITLFINSVIFNTADGKLIGTVNLANERKMLTLSLLPPQNSESRITEGIEEEQWPQIFGLACSLYGGSRNSEKVFRQFTKDLKKEKYEPKDRVIIWDKKIDGVQYMVKAKPSEKYYGRFDLLSVNLFNDLCYDDYLAMMELRGKRAEIENATITN